MTLDSFKKSLDDLRLGMDWLKKNGNSPVGTASIKNFKLTQLEHHKNLVHSSIIRLNSLIWELYKLKKFDKIVDEIGSFLATIENDYKNGKLNSSDIDKITNLLDKININPESKDIHFKIPKLPDEIRADVAADILEMQKCYKAELHRSAAILCGRMLEIALHRKYFEVTGVDVLEKHPEIGLGNLIAKLVEKGVHFDPGLTQQIHLINQVRVHSVHKKQEAFMPSKMQTQAMILYTMDALEKLFK